MQNLLPGSSLKTALKDILEKVLLSCEDVFADCWNALVCGGRQVLDGTKLLPAPTESFYFYIIFYLLSLPNPWHKNNMIKP